MSLSIVLHTSSYVNAVMGVLLANYMIDFVITITIIIISEANGQSTVI